MKKLLALFIALMMVFSLAACGDNNTTDPDKDNPGASQTEDQSGEEKQATESTPSSSGQSEDAGSNEVEIPTTGTPIG